MKRSAPWLAPLLLACAPAPDIGAGANPQLRGGVGAVNGVMRDGPAEMTHAGEPVAMLRPPAVRGVLPADRFCAAFADAFCGDLAACGCGESKETCYTGAEMDCQGSFGMMGPEVRGALAKGRLTYDGRAAHRFVRRIAEASQRCGNPIEALGWDHRDLFSFGDVFTGHVAPGAACDLPFVPFRANECAGGVCAPDRSGGGTCVALAEVGDACGPAAMCADPGQPLEFRDFLNGHLWGYCAPTPYGEPLCVRRQGIGEACKEAGACDSGRCLDARCAPLAEAGEACARDLDCARGFCSDGACAAPQRPLGAACVRHAECASQACYRGQCAAPRCRGQR